MTTFKVYAGTSSELDKKSLEEGSVYFVTDTKEIYADVPGQNRQAYGGKNGDGESGSITIDYDEIYAYTLKKMLNDPAAIFQGATATADSLPGLVPPLPTI